MLNIVKKKTLRYNSTCTVHVLCRGKFTVKCCVKLAQYAGGLI